MEIKSLEYLWKIISVCWLSNNIEEAKEFALIMYDCLLDFPQEVEELLVDFAETDSKYTIDDLACYLAKNRSFAAEQHTILVGILIKKKLISINEAAELLSTLGLSTLQLKSKTASKILRVKDVAWLINEDAKDGLMDADHDSLLEEALIDLVDVVSEERSYLKQDLNKV